MDKRNVLLAVLSLWYAGRAEAAVADFQLRRQSTGVVTAEWTQHAHDAQRTGYTTQTVPTPWRFVWMRGDVTPRSGYMVNPITGDGKVYIAAANNTLYALRLTDGQNAWTASPGGTLNSTPAYDPETRSVYVCASSPNRLYRLRSSDGVVIGSFTAAGALDTAPLLVDDTVYITAYGGVLYALDKVTLTQRWRYQAAASTWPLTDVTMPSYSASRGYVIFCTDQDINAHAVRAADGALVWRRKYGVNDYRSWTENSSTQYIRVRFSWPVVADNTGIVFVRTQHGYSGMIWQPFLPPGGDNGGFPATNAEIRPLFVNYPQYRSVYALSLDTGLEAFVPLITHGAYGDGALTQGPMPCVRTLPNGKQVAYAQYHNRQTCEGGWCDAVEDATIGEFVLDDTTVSGCVAGDGRFVDWPTKQGLQGDEIGPITGAGDMIFFAHWDWPLEGVRITDRSDGVGFTFANGIKTVATPWVVQQQSGCSCIPGGASRWCGNGTCAENNGRAGPPGFNVGTGGWHIFPYTIVSEGYVICKTVAGQIFVMENGNP
jgi:hypothetical protein